MRAVDLEARVIAAVDRIWAGQKVEHDFIECKREWPEEDKARQLAGSLNRAGGDPVIYIIGIDEKTGKLFDVSGVEVADWWAQVAAKFDQAPPEMVRHIPVAVGDEGKYVEAVAFASDRAPYVVKTGKDSPSFEVPMREGTRTRTARRDELLRLLIPSVSVPPVVALSGHLRVDHLRKADAQSSGVLMLPQDEKLDAGGGIRIYFEHDSSRTVTFPTHDMRGRLTVDIDTFPLKLKPSRKLTEVPGVKAPVMSPYPDGVTLEGPKAVSFDIQVLGLSLEDGLNFETAQSLQLEIEFQGLHMARPLKLDVTLQRSRKPSSAGTTSRVLGEWDFGHPGL